MGRTSMVRVRYLALFGAAGEYQFTEVYCELTEGYCELTEGYCELTEGYCELTEGYCELLL